MLVKKKGAIGATLTWVVATIIILFVIIIFLIASGAIDVAYIGKSSSYYLYITGGEINPLKFPEQQQSLYAISKNQEIRELILQGDYDEAEKKIMPILEKIGKGKTATKWWNLFILRDGDVIKKIRCGRIGFGGKDFQNFYLILNNELKLRLYTECQSGVECSDFL